MSEKDKGLTRREFLTATAAIVAMSAAGCNRKDRKITDSVNRKKRKWIRCAIIGTGIRGRQLLSSIVNVPRVSVKAICDVIPKNLEYARKITGESVRSYTNYLELLEQEKYLDAVIIATPLHLHSRMAIDALNAGTHVFCETALAHTFSECFDLVKAVEDSDKVFQVGYQGNFNPLFNKTIDVIREGKLGEITHIRSQWHMNDDGRMQVSDPSWERVINWRMYKEFSGGLMMEYGTHHVEFINRMLDSRPVAVTGFGGIDFWKDGREVYDNVNVVYQYPNGIKFVFTSLQNNAHNRAKIEILGKKGTIELSLKGGGRFFAEKPPITAAIRSVDVLVAPTGPSFKFFPSSKDKGESIKVDSEEKNSTYLQMESFFDCIREERVAICDVKSAYYTAITALAANKAMEELKSITCNYEI